MIEEKCINAAEAPVRELIDELIQISRLQKNPSHNKSFDNGEQSGTKSMRKLKTIKSSIMHNIEKKNRYMASNQSQIEEVLMSRRLLQNDKAEQAEKQAKLKYIKKELSKNKRKHMKGPHSHESS